MMFIAFDQWRNRPIQAVTECPPRDFPPGNFWRLIGKNEARKKGKKWEMLRKNGKNEDEN